MRRAILMALVASAAFIAGATMVRCIPSDPGQHLALIVLKGAAFSGEE